MGYIIALLMLPISDYSVQQVLEQGNRHVMMMKQPPELVAQCIQRNVAKQGGDLSTKWASLDKYPGSLQVVVSPSNRDSVATAVAQVQPVAGGSQAYLWIAPNSYMSTLTVADTLWSGC